MSTTSEGRIAEEKVADHLATMGHKILHKNWRTKWCEIDIITTMKECVYFVEVKYRTNPLYGSGLEYITKSKLKQMHFAAELWLSQNNWQGEVSILAAEVDINYKINLVEI